jgi:outer membrane lipoprotein-sorting protein
MVVIAALALSCWRFWPSAMAFQDARGVRGSEKNPTNRDATLDFDPPAEVPKSPSPEAKQALDQARQKLLAYQSIKAKLTETVALSNRKFTAHGSYFQGRGSDLKLRLEFQVKLGDTEGALLEVCDGQVLWTRHNVGGEIRITRRDVRQILQAAAEHGFGDHLITVELGFGGLPGLFAAVEDSVIFDDYKETTLDDRKWIVLEGGWKPALLKLWQGGKPNAPLPEYVPTRIRVYLDGESLFPRRILYLNHNAEKVLRPVVRLDFTEIEVDTAIPAEKFQFMPPNGIFPEDLTSQFLDRIKQRRQASKPSE